MTTESSLLLSMAGIGKSFGAVTVLDDVHLQLRAGEVLGLVGENGAGKSTLIKILTGLYTLDSGQIELAGQAVQIRRPADAEALGIEVIHQDRHLAGRLTVAEQLYLGTSRNRGLWRHERTVQEAARADILRTTGQELDTAAFVDELSVAQQQLIQIARAVLAEPKVLILDEPTAPLANDEVEQLFGTIGHLRDRGVGIIFISHYLQELQQVTDRITVLRNGRNAGDASFAHGDSISDVIGLMLGSQVNEFSHQQREAPARQGEPALQLSGLSVAGKLEGIDLTVAPGEIVAVTGLVGSGIEVLADAVTGNHPHAGTALLHGRPVVSAADFVARAGAYVPSNRHRDGIFLRNTVRENVAAASLRKLGRRLGLLNARKERDAAEELVQRLDIRPADPEAVASGLSGGNQQKTVLARWLAKGSDVLVLDQPTSGVDVGSRAQIYAQISQLVQDGAAALMVSVDLEEVVGLADRVLVLYRGRIIAELPSAEVTTERILQLASSGQGTGTPREEVNA
ncbi:sugar ABC transporter ATP-binding protein [Glutamicibacter sp. FBE19]|uniref:sugar ABC transporter ATP-binding protein n=1 Tax=Glutamicibacter sp. FBE19 TaxID=2761534 RepID=UPI0018964F6F|nr:sugar ABC transporter ATP-binding protein [Glutamicibacter sp. FBE19]MBF6670306.1 sugar ABC transporter ATP-binding protein [Glutamicibacter sp. FBE19]